MTVGLIVIIGALYSRVLVDLVRQWWDDPNYSHGFVVPLMAGFMAWRRRAELATASPRGSWLGLPVLLAGVSALVLGDVAAEAFLMRASLIVVLAGLVLFHLGPDVLRLLTWPLVFLLFMIPLPTILLYAATFPLQNLAARNAAWMLDLAGVPVLLDGNIIQLSQISLGVTEACSGIRSLISLLAIAIGWSYVVRSGFWSTGALVIAAVPITIVANACRVVATGLAGQWFGPQYAGGFYHMFSGWGTFLLACGGLLGIHALLRLATSTWLRRRS